MRAASAALHRVRRVDPDEELVRRARIGDLRAFEELVARHRDVVFRVAARIVGPDEADDVTQDVFLRAFHRLRQFRGDAPFRAWLLRITHNAALNALERRRDAPGLETEQVEREHEGAPVLTPSDALERSEQRARLGTKLAQLTPAHRAVLVLRDLEGLSYAEIADATGMPLGSVKARLHRGRAELIELLRSNTYDWRLPE